MAGGRAGDGGAHSLSPAPSRSLSAPLLSPGVAMFALRETRRTVKKWIKRLPKPLELHVAAAGDGGMGVGCRV